MDKRELILLAATDNFQAKGFAGTTISQVAKDANIGKGTVYEYFQSKEEILMHCCIRNCQSVENNIDLIVGNLDAEKSNPVKVVYTTLHTVLSQFFSKGVEDNRLFYELSVLISTRPDIKKIVSKEFQQKLAQWQSMALADYMRGLDQGYFRQITNPDDLAVFIVATVDGLIWQMQWSNEEELKSRPHRIASMYLQLIMNEPEQLEELIK